MSIKRTEMNDTELEKITAGADFELTSDSNWRYVDPATGKPVTGWQNNIPGWEGRWLYFDETGRLIKSSENGNPFAEAFPFQTNGQTKDGYNVDVNGEWDK